MPPWPYVAPSDHGGTPGLAWFGANETGFENEHQLSTVFQNYSMVVFGWQALLTAPANYSRELSLLVEQCQIVKKALTSQGYPNTPVIVYCDNLRVQPFYGALRKIMRDPLYQDFFLRAPGLKTSQGEAGYIPATTYCSQMGQQPLDPKCLCWYWNLFNESAVEYYLNELLLPQAKLPGFDGVFFVSSLRLHEPSLRVPSTGTRRPRTSASGVTLLGARRMAAMALCEARGSRQPTYPPVAQTTMLCRL